MNKVSDRLGKRTATVAKSFLQVFIERSQIYAAEEMKQSQGFSGKKLVYNQQPADPSKLTSRTNRFIAMLQGLNYKGNAEGRVSKVTLTGTTVTASKTITLPYFAIHEYGGTRPAMDITAKMRKFFWAMHYAEAGSYVKMAASILKGRGQSFKGKKAFTKAAKQEFTMWKALALKKGQLAAVEYPARRTMGIGIEKAQREKIDILSQCIRNEFL